LTPRGVLCQKADTPEMGEEIRGTKESAPSVASRQLPRRGATWKDINMMKDIPPPGDPVWVAVRARYEQEQETVAAIAYDVGMKPMQLSLYAKAKGWVLRGKVKPGKAQSTAATIKRLKEILQSRVTQLEDQLKDIGEEVTALSNERDIRATNTLVRTLEKVLDLERKDRLRKRKQAREFKYFDDAQRQQLADKIEKLERAWDGKEAVEGAADHGRGGAEQPVALLGEAKPAVAADS
jgi:hypothetical protein